MVKGIPAKVDRFVRWFGPYWGPLGVLWFVLGWIASRVSAIAQFGWAVVILVGLFCACLAALAAAALVWVWHSFHPASQTASPAPQHKSEASASVEKGSPFEKRLYVGRMDVSYNALLDTRLEISAVCFNGSSDQLIVKEVRGYVLFGGEPGNPKSRTLPPPTLSDRFGRQIGPTSEFIVVLNQPLPAPIAAEIKQTFGRGEPIIFSFGLLNIMLSALAAPAVGTRLPLWDGARCDNGQAFTTGRIIYASLRAAI